MNEVMFSSKSDNWETPQDLFDHLDKIFHFDIDVCATKENSKCEKYYTPEMDGLKQEWKGVCWCNPPYGREIGKWVEKAYKSNCMVVMLLPARTDTKWFHDYCMKGICIFIKGRLYFGRNGWTGRAPFPSLICIFE